MEALLRQGSSADRAKFGPTTMLCHKELGQLDRSVQKVRGEPPFAAMDRYHSMPRTVQRRARQACRGPETLAISASLSSARRLAPKPMTAARAAAEARATRLEVRAGGHQRARLRTSLRAAQRKQRQDLLEVRDIQKRNTGAHARS
jgi:hypothetical protein